MMIPHKIRTALMTAYDVGDGKTLLTALGDAREFFKGKHEKMSSGRSDLIDVSLEWRAETEEAVAFFDGEIEEAGERGRRSNREIWQWCPKRLIEVERHGDDRACTVTMPEWLAQDKGFI